MQQDPSVQPQQPVQQVPQHITQPVAPTYPAVDQVVQQGMDLHHTLNQPDTTQSDQPLSNDQIPDDSGLDSSPTDTKNPLDMLEEILGKGAPGEGDAEEDNEPKEPEQTPEEIEAERQLRLATDQAAIEAHRQKMMQEVGSDDQKKRDQIRTNQSESLKSSNDHTIHQLQHKKIMVEE